MTIGNAQQMEKELIKHTPRLPMLKGVCEQIGQIKSFSAYGEVVSLVGSKIHVRGLEARVSIGSVVEIKQRSGSVIKAEVVGFEGKDCIVMSYHPIGDLGPGCRVYDRGETANLYPHHSWLGRVLNSFAEPIDREGPLASGGEAYDLFASPPAAHERRLVEKPLDLGIRAMNIFTTCCQGQRMGIFAGSGVGKSVLLSMLAKFSSADIIVIGLIGERGREVREFLENYLGPEGRKRSVTIVATSDETALMRRRAAYTTVAVAEYFRDQGLEVLCLMDSVTRFAMALREIGLARGEPPTTKGYTPNVFVELPQLLERAGPGSEHQEKNQANITGLFTVLVEGDDTNEPVSDTVRGILDGHIILDRKIAERGRFPAINVLKSISRTMPDCNTENETACIKLARKYLSTYDDMEELIRIGAYRKGTNPEVDEALFYATLIDDIIAQEKNALITHQEAFEQLQAVLETPAV